MKSDLTAVREGNGPVSCDFAWLSGERKKMYYWPMDTVASIIYEDKVPGFDCPGNKIFNSINWLASGALSCNQMCYL